MKIKKILSAILVTVMVFSAVCVSSSAEEVHINMDFEDIEVFKEQFISGKYWTDDTGYIFGYDGSGTIETQCEMNDEGFISDGYCWLTYDAEITFIVTDDDLSENDRYLDLVYCNDNPWYMGESDERIFMIFCYDIQGRCFRLTSSFDNTEEAEQYMEPVYRDIPIDGSERIAMGISVGKDSMRCYYNNELIFDFQNTEFYIGHKIPSPFLFWQQGNYIEVSRINVTEYGYILTGEGLADDGTCDHKIITVPAKAPTCTEDGWDEYEKCIFCDYTTYKRIPSKDHPDINIIGAEEATKESEGYTGDVYCNDCGVKLQDGTVIPKLLDRGDADGDGKITLADVSVILKSIAGWNVSVNTDAADVTGDGNITLADVSLILKYIAKWDVTL